MKFAIAMGFRDAADRGGFRYVPGKSSRQAIHDWVFDRYRTLWPDAEIFESEGPEGPPNRAAMRNHAVRAALSYPDVDVIAVVDADVIPMYDQMQEGIDAIRRFDGVQWVTPYVEYAKVGRKGTRAILAQPPSDPIARPKDLGWSTPTGTAGLMLVSREAWETVGGYDETFAKWSFEDWAIVVALETLVHGVTRTHGSCLHLEHDRSPTRLREKKEQAPLYAPYEQAHGNPEAMRALLRERGVLT